MRTLLGLILVIATFRPAPAQTSSPDNAKKPSPAAKQEKTTSDSAARPKTDSGSSQKATKASKKQDENIVQEGAVKTGKTVGRVGQDTGELAAKGAVETGRAVSRGAKWIARPWSKDKKSAASAR